MKTITVGYEKPKISINGSVYAVSACPDAFFTDAVEYIRGLVRLDTGSVTAIRESLQAGCDLIDTALGSGSMAAIAAGEPVSLTMVIEIIRAIMDVSKSAYAAYIDSEYGGIK